MSNYMFSPKPFEGSYPMKDQVGFNRNFTTNFMSTHLFPKKEGSISSQSQIDTKTDFLSFSQKPTSPGVPRDVFEVNYKVQYQKLMERHRKKEEKFKKVLFEWQNQLQIKESLISDCQRELERMRGEPPSTAGRELSKVRDKLRECQLSLERSEKARRDLEYELEKQRKVMENHQMKERVNEYYDVAKPKEYYVAKLIECQNALREREEKLSKIGADIVHNRSQVEYSNRQAVADDKMSLIKALNHKRLIEDDLNKTIARLSSELSESREKLRESQEGRNRVSGQLSESLMKHQQLVYLNRGYLEEISGLKQKQGRLVEYETQNSLNEEEISNLKEEVEKLNGSLLVERRERKQVEGEVSGWREKYSFAAAEKEVTQLKYKEEKNLFNTKVVALEKELEGARMDLEESRSAIQSLERELVLSKESLALRNTQMEEELRVVTGRIQTFESRIQSDESVIQQLTERNNTLELDSKQSLTDKQAQIDALSQQLSVSVQQNKVLEQSVSRIQSQLMVHQETVNLRESTIKSLTETLHTISLEQDALRDSQTLSNQQLLSLRSTNDTLKSQGQEFSRELSDKDIKIKAKTEEFRVFGQKIEELITKLQVIQEENDTLQAQNGYIKEKLLESEKELESKQGLAESLLMENTSIVIRLKENEDSTDGQIKSMRELVEEKQSESKELSGKVEELETVLKRVRQESEENAMRLSEELITATKGQEQAEGKLVHSTRLLQEQESKRKEMEKQLKGLKGSKSESEGVVKGIKVELESVLGANKDITKKLQESKREKVELQGVITVLREEIKSLKKVDKVKPKEKKQPKEKQRVESKVEKTKSKGDNELVEARSQIERLRQSQEQLEKEIKELKFLVNQSNESCRKSQGERSQFEAKVTQLEVLAKELGEKIEIEVGENQEKTFIIASLEEQVSAASKELEEKGVECQEARNMLESVEEKLIQAQVKSVAVEQKRVILENEVNQMRGIFNYCIIRQLIPKPLQPPPVQSPLKQDRSAAVQKHILQLISKIEWMEENLNFINQENNDLQNQLEQKDIQVFDLRKMLEKNQITTRQLKGHLDKSNKKLHRNQDLIAILNQELLSLQFGWGDMKYQEQGKKGSQCGGQDQSDGEDGSEKSIEDLVIQSMDLE